ncbi:MAG: hypothetical protein OEV73_01885 [Desulfobulbaceae bacterium]|nr:hypothetical protein [Desulfobulbaceae bacterium]
MANERKPGRKPDHPLQKAPLWLSLFFLALLLVGIAIDEPGRVLEQARQICLSCIGVG